MSVLPVQNDRVQLTTEAGDVWMNGLLMNGDKAVYATSSPVNYSNGIQRTANGAIYCVDATAGLPAGATWTNGLPFNTLGALCISNNAVVTWSNGIPFDANGAVCAAYLPIPDLDLDFTLGILDPRITFSRATGATVTGSNGLIQNAPMNLPRFDYDPVTLQPKGLLIEEQRTNLLTYSEQFDNAAWTKVSTSVTANTTVAPNGTTTADTVSISGSLSNVTQTLALGAGTYTLSAYVKSLTVTTPGTLRLFMLVDGVSQSFTFTPTAEWTRQTFTVTAATSLTTVQPIRGQSYIGDVALWGAQLEAGAFATSYIPTVASQVTRAADSASMTGTNFSSWYNQTNGTVFAQYSVNGLNPGASNAAFGITDNTTSNFIAGRTLSSAATNFQVRTGGADQVTLNSVTVAAGAVAKSAGAYALNDFAFSANAGTVQTDTSGTLPFVTQMQIGGLTSASNPLNGTISRIAYYNRRLANTELTAITS
jgi:hypothetical protein